jgi:hypothetical protein
MVQPTANAFITDFDLHLRTDSPQHPITFVQLIPKQRWGEKEKKQCAGCLLAAADGSLTMFSGRYYRRGAHMAAHVLNVTCLTLCGLPDQLSIEIINHL